MNKVTAIIQARMGSKRFPGKMLEKLGDHLLIEWVLLRMQKCKQLDEIILATSTLSIDDALVEVASNYKIKIFRGSEENVLDRYISAGNSLKAQTIVRVCADNPFVDPVEVDRLIKFYQREKCTYACNHQNKLGNNYADGFGAEIFDLSLLLDIKNNTVSKDDCEHVTLYLWKNTNKYVMNSIAAPPEIASPELRFDVDTKEDLERLRKIVSLGVCIESLAAEIIKKSKECSI
jgi:spore coat polysaccharide biosynthesis protein SpsF